jgi:hypothetical protein
MWVLLGLFGVLTCGCTYKLLARRPKRPSLVLYERGIRFRKIVAHFDDLESIRIGREYSKAESHAHAVNQFFARFRAVNAMVAAIAETCRQNSLTLVFKCGETKPLKGALTYPLPEDPKPFFDRLQTLHPELVKGSLPTPESTSARPGLDDLPFKMTPV